MCRELEEETGLICPSGNWEYFALLKWSGSIIVCFKTRMAIDSAATPPNHTEPVRVQDIAPIAELVTPDNFLPLMLMAHSKSSNIITIEYL